MAKSIEEQRQAAQNTSELVDHLINLIEQNDDRFSFVFASGGEHIEMELFDKEKNIEYMVKIDPIEYNKDGGNENV